MELAVTHEGFDVPPFNILVHLGYEYTAQELQCWLHLQIQWPKTILQDVCQRVDKAFERYIKGDKDGKRSGKPRFKNESRYRTLVFDGAKNEWLKFCTINGRWLYLKLPKIKLHQHIARSRQDFHYKTAHKLVRTGKKVFFHEDLNLAGLTKRNALKQDEQGNYLPNGQSAKSGLNKSWLDAAFGQFFSILGYIAEKAGAVVIE